MKRRTFSALAGTLAVMGSGLSAVGRAVAQGGPVEGVNYQKLGEPLPVAPGRIQVLEFFSYGCPHCSAFEPELEAWTKTLPKDVAFQRIPVPFLFNAENFQKLYYTLDSLGLVETTQIKVFNAVHRDHERLDKFDDLAAFAEKNGIDNAKFTSVFNSFGVATKVRQAATLAAQYRLDGVPTLGIQGRYTTSPSTAGGTQKALATVDFLVQRVRAG